MCTSRQYMFLCQHEATAKFRDTVCDSPGVRGCVVKNVKIQLTEPCMKCSLRGRKAMRTQVPEPAFDDVWHVRSVCFVDIGFRSLHPFQERNASDSVRPETPAEPPILGNGQSLNRTPCKKNPSLYKRIMMRLTTRKRAKSACRAKDDEGSPFLATGIESTEHSTRGVNKKDRCESPFSTSVLADSHFVR